MSPQSHRWRVLGPLLLILALPILAAPTARAAPPGTPVLHQSAELVSPALDAQNRQGGDVALSADGSTLAVANATHSHYGPAAVVVYVRSADRWHVQTTLRSPPNTDGQNLWADAIALSGDGDVLAVADPTARNYAGVVYLFTRSGQTWRAAGQLVAPQTRSNFGSDMSMSGDGATIALVGAGNAYIADTESRVVQLLPRPVNLPAFGGSVAISPDGDTIVVGAPGSGRGAAAVLVDDPMRGWIERWRLQAQPDAWDSDFGVSVAVTDTHTVVVGESYIQPAVSVFEQRGPALVRTARFTPMYRQQAYRLGASVTVSADGSTVWPGPRFARPRGARSRKRARRTDGSGARAGGRSPGCCRWRTRTAARLRGTRRRCPQTGASSSSAHRAARRPGLARRVRRSCSAPFPDSGRGPDRSSPEQARPSRAWSGAPVSGVQVRERRPLPGPRRRPTPASRAPRCPRLRRSR